MANVNFKIHTYASITQLPLLFTVFERKFLTPMGTQQNGTWRFQSDHVSLPNLSRILLLWNPAVCLKCLTLAKTKTSRRYDGRD